MVFWFGFLCSEYPLSHPLYRAIENEQLFERGKSEYENDKLASMEVSKLLLYTTYSSNVGMAHITLCPHVVYVYVNKSRITTP